MKVDLVYWLDRFGGRTDRLEIELKPFGYRMAPITQWKTLIANEDVKVEKGKPTVIKTKTVEIPENTMVGPLNIMRHALGVTLDVVECGIPDKVEENKCINEVLFLPVDDGEVRKGDLIGVLKVFFIRTGLLSRLFSISPPKVELTEEIVEANLTWRYDGDIHRERFRTKVFGYTRSHIGVWELLVADESREIRTGEVTRIKIRDLKLPPNTVVVPLSIMRNAYGSVLDVVQLGKPSRVEDEKIIHQAVFLPIEDGVIEKGDLLGVINVYYVGVKNVMKIEIDKKTENVNLVYKSEKGVGRKNIETPSLGFKRGHVARWECLVSDEDRIIEYGKPTILKIKDVVIPKNTIPYPFSIARHAYGTCIDIYMDRPKKVEEEFVASKVIFLPIANGIVRKGEIVGILNLYNIEIAGLNKVKEWLDKWVDQVSDVFSSVEQLELLEYNK
jgi:hypothetical protein